VDSFSAEPRHRNDHSKAKQTTFYKRTHSIKAPRRHMHADQNKVADQARKTHKSFKFYQHQKKASSFINIRRL